MAREVTHDAHGPRIVTPEDIDDEKGDVAVCLCGLSEEYPFCDGSHRRTLDEDDDAVYRYVDGERRRVERIVYADESETDAAAESDESDATAEAETNGSAEAERDG
jgi:CDGSH-type Zn-finger protein